MRRSTDKILTTHVGALPGPAETWSGENVSDDALKAAIKDVVARQRKAGVDIVNEGELTKGGNWVTTGTCTGSWVMPATTAYNPPLVTSNGGVSRSTIRSA